jgi:hypothetical protein
MSWASCQPCGHGGSKIMSNGRRRLSTPATRTKARTVQAIDDEQDELQHLLDQLDQLDDLLDEIVRELCFCDEVIESFSRYVQ